jgi:hypothetical protein
LIFTSIKLPGVSSSTSTWPCSLISDKSGQRRTFSRPVVPSWLSPALRSGNGMLPGAWELTDADWLGWTAVSWNLSGSDRCDKLTRSWLWGSDEVTPDVAEHSIFST